MTLTLYIFRSGDVNFLIGQGSGRKIRRAFSFYRLSLHYECEDSVVTANRWIFQNTLLDIWILVVFFVLLVNGASINSGKTYVCKIGIYEFQIQLGKLFLFKLNYRLVPATITRKFTKDCKSQIVPQKVQNGLCTTFIY